jgi:hypothetical protein
MTPDMKFEGLLVSRDLQVLKAMSGILDDLSIDVDICMTPSRTLDVLGKRDIDLLVVDWDVDTGSPEIIRAIRNTVCRRVTVAAIVGRSRSGELAIQAGVHAVIQKPLWSASKCEFHTFAYSRMVAERRQQARYSVRWLVAAKDMSNRPVPVTLTDISAAGLGLLFTGKLVVGDLLKFQLFLPGTNYIIRCEARVVWTLRGRVAGAEFENISAVDSSVLHKWLQQKHQVKDLAPLASERYALSL